MSNSKDRRKLRRATQGEGRTQALPTIPTKGEKIWLFIEHPLTLAAIGLVLTVVAHFFGFILLVAWLCFVAAIHRTKVFGKLSRNKKWVAYISIPLVFAVVLYGVHWKIRDIIPPIPTRPDLIGEIEWVALGILPTDPTSALVTLGATIKNRGTPSIADNMRVFVRLGTEEIPINEIIPPPGPDKIILVSFEDQKHAFKFTGADYLPRKAGKQPIGDVPVGGYIRFIIRGHSRDDMAARKDCLVVLRFEDVNGRGYQAESECDGRSRITTEEDLAARIVTVSPSRILVRSKEWSRLDIITVTNHQESPRYGLDLLIKSSTPEIEFEMEDPYTPSVHYKDGTKQFLIFQIGPKASYVFHLKSKLRNDAKSTQAEIQFSVTDGTAEPEPPRVMIKQQ